MKPVSEGSTVRQYADGLASSSAFQAVLIDGDILRKYRANGGEHKKTSIIGCIGNRYASQ